MAPSEYTYCVKSSVASEFLQDINREKNTFIGNISYPNSGSPFILNGYNKVNDTEIWIINQEKQGYYYLWFKSREEAVNLYNYIYDKKNKY